MASKRDTRSRAGLSLSHPLFGDILRESLAPVDVIVEQDQRVLSESPRVDVILIHPRGDIWTDAQRARLPDGIRDVSAQRVLLELKYSESLASRNTDALFSRRCPGDH